MSPAMSMRPSDKTIPWIEWRISSGNMQYLVRLSFTGNAALSKSYGAAFAYCI